MGGSALLGSSDGATQAELPAAPSDSTLLPGSAQSRTQQPDSTKGDASLRALRQHLLHGARKLEAESKRFEVTMSTCRQLLGQAASPLVQPRRRRLVSEVQPPKFTYWESVLDDLPPWEPPNREGTIFPPSSWMHQKPAVLLSEEPSSELLDEAEPSSGSGSSAPPAHLSVNPMVTTPWGKVKSAVFLSSLQELRRAGGSKGPAEDDKDSQLFRQTLGDPHDTAEMLRSRREELQEAVASTLVTGGERHPTVILSRRCLALVERKLGMLETLEEKCFAFEAIHARGEELWEGVLAGSILGDDIVGVAGGFRNFVRDVAHSGDPLEADKSDFNFFLQQLGLPPGHDMIVRSQKALRKGVQASCRCALDVFARRAAGVPDTEAKALAINTMEAVNLLLKLSTQAKHTVVRQLKAEALKLRARFVLSEVKEANSMLEGAKDSDGPMLLKRAGHLREIVREAVEFGVPDEAEEIKQAKLMVLGLRAHTVLQNARRLQENDKNKPDNRVAVHSASTIREECAAALEYGVLANDSALAAARYIAATLHAGKVLRVAQHEKEEDARALERNVYIAGDATAAAERIDGELKEALQANVPRDHPMLEEARNLAKYLREQEFLRKRMIASNARRKGS